MPKKSKKKENKLVLLGEVTEDGFKSPTPQARRFVEAVLTIDERRNPDPEEKAFLTRYLVQVTLPHKNPGNSVPVWKRTNGNLTLKVQPIWDEDKEIYLYPYGTIPRLLLFWITTEALRTKNRRLLLGHTLSEFMRDLELIPTGGRWGSITRLRDQMERLFRARISLEQTGQSGTTVGKRWSDMEVAPDGELWWDVKRPDHPALWESWIELGEKFYTAIINAPVPLDMRALRALKKSPLALDLYALAAYKSYVAWRKGKEQFVPWEGLALQIGSDYSDDAKGSKNFRQNVRKILKRIYQVYPELRVDDGEDGLVFKPCRPAVPVRPPKRQ